MFLANSWLSDKELILNLQPRSLLSLNTYFETIFLFLYELNFAVVIIHVCFPPHLQYFTSSVHQVFFLIFPVHGTPHTSMTHCNLVLFIQFQAASVSFYLKIISYSFFGKINLPSNTISYRTLNFSSCLCSTFMLFLSLLFFHVHLCPRSILDTTKIKVCSILRTSHHL